MASSTGNWNWTPFRKTRTACLPAKKEKKEKERKEKDKERKGKEKKKKRKQIFSFLDLSFVSNTAGKGAGGPKYCT